VSQAPIAEVLAALRSAGLAPAAEDSSGTIVDIRARGARVPAPPRRRTFRPPPSPSSQTLEAIVAVLRKVAAAHPTAQIHIYAADHGFNCDQRGSYDAASARLARERTLAFLRERVG
jgi:hypothetical protein